MTKRVAYNFDNKRYRQAIQVTLDPNCNSIMITNLGTTVMTVNDFPLHPGVPGTRNGEAFLMGGNAGEVLKCRVDIKFAGNTGDCMVTQKVYITANE